MPLVERLSSWCKVNALQKPENEGKSSIDDAVVADLGVEVNTFIYIRTVAAASSKDIFPRQQIIIRAGNKEEEKKQNETRKTCFFRQLRERNCDPGAVNETSDLGSSASTYFPF